MVEVKHITKSFEGRVVLNDISAVFETGKNKPDYRAKRLRENGSYQKYYRADASGFGRDFV